MPTLSDLLNNYIIKTKERLNQSNLKTYYKCCIDVLGEEEDKKIYFPNKTNRIVLHLKKCTHFFAATTPETRDEYFHCQGKSFICSSYGPLDNFILNHYQISCGWALHWVNNPEVRELFEFLNPFLKLPDHKTLGGPILNDAISKGDNTMKIALKEDPVGITLTFDGWMNVKSEQLLGVVLMTLKEGLLYGKQLILAQKGKHIME
ncbi:hypothetical protein GLOIN_2v1885672 [Rhizophagus clarus]|uniref:DUF659 domain-containing protein n=1 Tax=Rhizophagus clarus TaxID=94130 RepID=A0A8H3M975_9GLOM|nr:hypothetical protein GLOIN_2v1885672 [Rhizophagus clarus]